MVAFEVDSINTQWLSGILYALVVGNNLVSIDYSANATLRYAQAQGPLLANVLIGIMDHAESIAFPESALTQASVDHVINQAYASKLAGAPLSGVLALQGGTNAAPGPDSSAALSALLGLGITVVHN